MLVFLAQNLDVLDLLLHFVFGQNVRILIRIGDDVDDEERIYNYNIM